MIELASENEQRIFPFELTLLVDHNGSKPDRD
ncbi:hypothetical protein SAMN06265222_104185 [Neorhodopirellula lusitana]|uniref:Uncharacterized protein n=1 Tax=Neorhodopirellula lusitana TaxID=445327 RepID=A0ABY1PZC3_9BACT|nr:hypothetical protein SAMN06265222_104185 [Neorhodopirellula lusitana]